MTITHPSSRPEPKGAARKRRRTAAQPADEHAAKALKLRSLAAADQVRRAMEYEPQCVPKLLDALKDLGTLGRLGCEPAEELSPVRKNQLALANVLFYDEHAQTPEQALDTPTKLRRGSSLCELPMDGSDASSTRASPPQRERGRRQPQGRAGLGAALLHHSRRHRDHQEWLVGAIPYSYLEQA